MSNGMNTEGAQEWEHSTAPGHYGPVDAQIRNRGSRTAPSLGRTVLYTLSKQDADVINHATASRDGVVGNGVVAGNVFPAVVVRVWAGDLVNLQVLLDGNSTFWATSVHEGDTERTWAWPPRV